MIITLWIEHLSSAYEEGRKTCVVLRQCSDFGGEEGRKTSLRRYLDFGEEKSSKTCKASVSDFGIQNKRRRGWKKEQGRRSRSIYTSQDGPVRTERDIRATRVQKERWYLVWHDDICM